jgi:hypothetical protein
MEWKHLTSPVEKKFRIQPSVERVMFTLFWDAQGPILEQYQERVTAENSVHYIVGPEYQPGCIILRVGNLAD